MFDRLTGVGTHFSVNRETGWVMNMTQRGTRSIAKHEDFCTRALRSLVASLSTLLVRSSLPIENRLHHESRFVSYSLD
jgi:hypothetical protein